MSRSKSSKKWICWYISKYRYYRCSAASTLHTSPKCAGLICFPFLFFLISEWLKINSTEYSKIKLSNSGPLALANFPQFSATQALCASVILNDIQWYCDSAMLFWDDTYLLFMIFYSIGKKWISFSTYTIRFQVLPVRRLRCRVAAEQT